MFLVDVDDLVDKFVGGLSVHEGEVIGHRDQNVTGFVRLTEDVEICIQTQDFFVSDVY